LEIDSLFDSFFKLQDIDLSILKNSKDNNALFEAPFLPSVTLQAKAAMSDHEKLAPHHALSDDIKKEGRLSRRGSIIRDGDRPRRPSIDLMRAVSDKRERRGSVDADRLRRSRAGSIDWKHEKVEDSGEFSTGSQVKTPSRFAQLAEKSASTLVPSTSQTMTLPGVSISAQIQKRIDDFICNKLSEILDLNFLYIPLILSVIYKPMTLISTQIEGICQKTYIKDLLQDKRGTATTTFDEINSFFREHLSRFIIVFKIEYMKIIHDAINANDQANLNAHKNLAREEQKKPEQKKQIIAQPKKIEEQKREEGKGQPNGQNEEVKTNQAESKPEPNNEEEKVIVYQKD